METVSIPGFSGTVPVAVVREMSADFERFMRTLPIVAALEGVSDEGGPAAFYELRRAGIDLAEIAATQSEIAAIFRAAAAWAALRPAGRLH
jgi:hypothetical protein